MGDEPGETRSTGRTGGPSDADNGRDLGRRKHIGGGGEEIRRPTLVGCGGEAEESDGGPGVGRKEGMHVRNKHDGQHTNGADEERKLAAGVDAVAVLHAEAGEPAPGDGADAGSGVDDDERIFDVG